MYPGDVYTPGERGRLNPLGRRASPPAALERVAVWGLLPGNGAKEAHEHLAVGQN